MSVPRTVHEPQTPAELMATAQRARMRVLQMCAGRGQGYAGQGLALADVLAHLYFRVMRRRADGTYLDRFVLSTGHSAIALFAMLGEARPLRTGRAEHIRSARIPDRGKPAGGDARVRDHRRLSGPGLIPGRRHGPRRTAARQRGQGVLRGLGRRARRGPGVGGGHVRQPLRARQPYCPG